MYLVRFTKQASKDAKRLKAAGLDKKAKDLIEILKNNPFAVPPSYEALVGNLAGLYSRRISFQHRLVYQVISNAVIENNVEYEGTVKVIRMWTHYDSIH